MKHKILKIILYLAAASVPLSGFAQNLEPLLDKLTEKGIITTEEKGELQRQQAQKISPLPFYLKVSGRIQFRFTTQQNDSKTTGSYDSFRIRRARLAADGTLIEDVDFHLEVDVSRTAALEEAEIRLLKFPQANITLGQFKQPFSMENMISPKKLDMVDLSQIVSALAPDKDIGIMAGGKFIAKRLGYQIALANGNGINNTTNDDDRFLYTARLEGLPVEHLRLGSRELNVTLGGNAAYSHDAAARAETIFGVTRALGASSSGRRKLAGADIAARLGTLSLKAEYLTGTFDPDDAGLRLIRTRGGYIQAGWFLHREIQALARYETFDPDKSVSNNSDIRWTTLGLNYFISGHDLKTQANYVFKREKTNSLHNDTLLLSLQLLF
jgi:phosphate-selective porin